VASGSVTPGTAEERVLARLPDTPDLQRLLRRSPGSAARSGAPLVIMLENRSIYNTESRPGDQPRSPAGYGKDGDLTGPDREYAETSMLALHLLQAALVNTLPLQRVLEAPGGAGLLGKEPRLRADGG
jgi:hypothetical protein